MQSENLNSVLKRIKEIAYGACVLKISDLEIEPESKEYKACKFKLNDLKIISRNAKITPKKIGQFVTFWKRNPKGNIEPFSETDEMYFYVINVSCENRIGQFILPKSALIENRIIRSGDIDGKRGFRVYPIWDNPTSKQAIKTQKWQLAYFIEFDNEIDLNVLKKLYKNR